MVIAFEAQRCRSDSVCAAHHDTRIDNALSRVPNFYMRKGEVVSDAVPNSGWHHAELPGSRINSRLHRLVHVIGNPPGNLGEIPRSVDDLESPLGEIQGEERRVRKFKSRTPLSFKSLVALR